MKPNIHPENYRTVLFYDSGADEGWLIRSCAPTSSTMKFNRLRSVDTSTLRALFPIRSLLLAELVHTGSFQAEIRHSISFLPGHRLAQHPLRAGAALRHVAHSAKEATILDGLSIWNASREINDSSDDRARLCFGKRCGCGSEGTSGDGESGCLEQAATADTGSEHRGHVQVLSGLVEAFVVELGLVFTEASALLLTPSSTRKTLINSSHNSNSGALL